MIPASSASDDEWNEMEAVLGLTVPRLDGDWGEFDVAIEEAVSELEDVQSDLHYRRAQDVLRDVVGRMSLTDREKAGLEGELAGLDVMLNKLEQQVIQIAVFGLVGRGKSSLLNALVGQPVFETGPTHGVTQSIQRTGWQLSAETPPASDHPLQRLTLSGVGRSHVELVDTPGIDEVNGAVREQLAHDLARQSDLILFVVSGDMTRVEYDALVQLYQANKPILLVFNKVDQYGAVDRQTIFETIRDERLRHLLAPENIVMAAAAPVVNQTVRRPDGTLSVQPQRGIPQVEELKLKILDILHREGKSLVALNTMLYADEVNEQIIRRKAEIRDRAANDLIWQAVMVKAVAIALNPITVLDLVGGVVIDVSMVVALSRLYGLPMSQKAALGLLKTIAFGAGSMTAGELAATVGLGSLKSVFGAAIPATGGASLIPYTSVAVAQGALAGLCSYGIGQITRTYLTNGANWGMHGPKAVIRNILETLDEESVLNHIKDELRLKLKIQA